PISRAACRRGSPPGPRPGLVGAVSTASTWSPAPRLRWEDTDASGRTGRTPDGLDTRRLDGWTAAGRTARPGRPQGDRTPDGWTPTAGPPDPDDEPGWVDAACWTPTAHRRHGRRPGSVDHGDDARPLGAARGP